VLHRVRLRSLFPRDGRPNRLALVHLLFPGEIPPPGPLNALSQDNVTQNGSFRVMELFSHRPVFAA
jgi:hypothetical protein